MKTLSIIVSFFFLISCAPDDTYRKELMQNNMELARDFEEHRKPVFEVKCPDGGCNFKEFKYYGETKPQSLAYHAPEYNPYLIEAIRTAGTLGMLFIGQHYNYEITKENNRTTRELYKGLTYGGSSTPAGSTSNEANTSTSYTVSEGGILVNGGSTYNTNDNDVTTSSTDSHDTSTAYTDSFNTLRYTTIDDHTSYDNDVDSSDHSNTDAVFTPTVVTPVITIEPTVIQPVVVTNPTTP